MWKRVETQSESQHINTHTVKVVSAGRENSHTHTHTHTHWIFATFFLPSRRMAALSAPGVLCSGLCCLLSAKYQFTILMRPGGPTGSRTHSLGGSLHSKCVRVVCVFKGWNVLGVMMCVFMCDADSYSSEVVGHILARYHNTVNLKPQFVIVPAVVTNDWSYWEEIEQQTRLDTDGDSVLTRLSG